MPLGANKAAIMGTAGVSTESVVLLQTQTADGDDNVAFTANITSAYPMYIFRFYNINPGTDEPYFEFQVDDNAGNNGYNDFNITSTFWETSISEADSGNTAYTGGRDSAQSTAYNDITVAIGSGADESFAGELHLFNPASTVYAKHFMSKTHGYYSGNQAILVHAAGYINTTTAINAINFKFTAGNFDGKIKMWGVK